jgi:hypothetical protein
MFSPAKPIEGFSETFWTRLWSKVTKKADADGGCWEWNGSFSKKRNGYRPNMQVGGRGSRTINPARAVCETYHGPPPSDLHEAGHTCPLGENHKCLRPEHLTWMTRVENEHHKRTYTKEKQCCPAPVAAE